MEYSNNYCEYGNIEQCNDETYAEIDGTAELWVADDTAHYQVCGQ